MLQILYTVVAIYVACICTCVLMAYILKLQAIFLVNEFRSNHRVVLLHTRMMGCSCQVSVHVCFSSCQ